jgi:hypothetical protein
MKKITKKSLGFTLVEILLMTGLITLGFSLLAGAYFKTQRNLEILKEAKYVMAIKEGAETLSFGETSYTGLNNTKLNDSNITPSAMKVPSDVTQILSSFSIPISVTSATVGTNVGVTDNSIQITYTGLMDEYCSQFVNQIASKFDEIEIDGVSVKSVTGGEFEVDSAAVVSQCNLNPTGATVSFYAVSSLMNSLAATTGTVTAATGVVFTEWTPSVPDNDGTTAPLLGTTPATLDAWGKSIVTGWRPAPN